MFVPKRYEFQISETKKKAGVFCAAHSCRNKPCKRKGGLCHKHYHRYRKTIDPIGERYADFKKNALSRSKEFTITLEQFREWCNENGYMVTKGCRGRRATIDRIDNQCGYHIWNIQLLRMDLNIKKYHEVDKLLDEALKNRDNLENN